MAVSRLDLDGKGAGSPEGLVTLILRAEPNLAAPVPIDRLCNSLDIEEIRDLDIEGFEGGLITDTERSRGVILVRKGHPFRMRFTIGHELGHFLIPTHMPDTPGRFLCSREDMRILSAAESNRRARMEVDANKFSSLILIPPPLLRPRLKTRRDPDLRHMAQLADEFEVSKQAMARAYAMYHEQILAIVFTKAGRVLFAYKHFKFPFIVVPNGQEVPQNSLLKRKGARQGVASDICECIPDIWIDVVRGRPAPALYEQVLGQRDEFAIVMLWLEPPEDDEEEDRDDERTSKERYRARVRSGVV